MKTIVRLLLIAGIISFAKGPLNTFKTQNPEAWHEAMATLQSIPTTVGQLIAHDAALIPKSPPSLEQKGTENQGSSSATQGNSSQGSPSSPTKRVSQSDNSAQPGQNQSISDWFTQLVKAFSSSSNSSGNTGPNGGAAVLNQALSQFGSAIPTNLGPFKNLEISGLTKTDTENLTLHCIQLNLISVLPQLEALSSNAETIDSNPNRFSKANQEKLTVLYTKTMKLLAMNSTFYLGDKNGVLSKEISFAKLLNDHQKNEPITVKLTDANSKKALAVFQVQVKPQSATTSASII